MSSVFAKTDRTRSPSSRWLVVGLLAVIAACLLVEVGLTASSGARAPLAAGAAGDDSVMVVAGQVTRDSRSPLSFT